MPSSAFTSLEEDATFSLEELAGFTASLELDLGESTAELEVGTGSEPAALDVGTGSMAALLVGSGFVPGPQASGKLDDKQSSSGGIT
jgi:hypothetical protein